MFSFTEEYLTISDIEFLDSIGDTKRKEILNSGCFRPKYQRVSDKTKTVCKKFQDEYKAWWKKARHGPGLARAPKWQESFVKKMIEKQNKKPVVVK